MSKYYYLVTGLPELTLDDSKASYSVADFKSDFYPFLTEEDKSLVDLFYLKYDNANVLKLMKDKDAVLKEEGVYSVAELQNYVASLKEGDDLSKKQFPSYLQDFVKNYQSAFMNGGSGNALPQDYLSSLYYDYAMKSSNDFVASWFELNLNINNLLIAQVARKYKLDSSHIVIGNTETCDAIRTSTVHDYGLQSELDYVEDVIKISEIADLVEREKKLDQLRWNWLEDKTFFDYFTIERLYVFLLQIDMLERWNGLDKEKGNLQFRNIIRLLKDEVKVPENY